MGGSFEKITLRRLEPAKHSRNALVAHARRGHKRTVRLRALGEERGGILSVVRVDEVDGEVVLGRILTAARERHASRSIVTHHVSPVLEPEAERLRALCGDEARGRLHAEDLRRRALHLSIRHPLGYGSNGHTDTNLEGRTLVCRILDDDLEVGRPLGSRADLAAVERDLSRGALQLRFDHRQRRRSSCGH